MKAAATSTVYFIESGTSIGTNVRAYVVITTDGTVEVQSWEEY